MGRRKEENKEEEIEGAREGRDRGAVRSKEGNRGKEWGGAREIVERGRREKE